MDKFLKFSSPSREQKVENIPKDTEEDSINSLLTKKDKKPSGRIFQEKWKSEFPWILYDKNLDKVFCSVCKCSSSKILPSATSVTDRDSYNAFVKNGFSNWKKAIERFKKHENGTPHRNSMALQLNTLKGTNVHSQISKAKLQEMKKARTSLMKILTSVNFLTQQGLAIRGHDEETSNIYQLLLLRTEDVPELKSWLSRNTYKWMSHDILNEMISLFSQKLQHSILQSIKQSIYFSIIIDETSDISMKEQVSMCFRFVQKNLKIEEMFLGFYETSSTTSSTLFEIVKDALTRFELNITNCRGQCYDGAANVSGRENGLQKKLLSIEPRAIFVHCTAHNLNLVVQDAMQNIDTVRDFLAVLRELISFVRQSPKRLAMFELLQVDEELESNKNYAALRPFCPTRWCVRIKSLKTLENNYNSLLIFLETISNQKNEAGGKANGYLTSLEQFKFLFLLKTLIKIFDRIEELHSSFQKKSLHYREMKQSIENLLRSLQTQRNDFSNLWNEVMTTARRLKIDEPVLPRRRKIPKRLDDGSPAHVFTSPEEFYRKIFFEIIDETTNSLNIRFEQTFIELLSQAESFALGDISVEPIAEFYKSDFNKDKLTLHRDMFLDICKSRKYELKSIADIVDIFNEPENACLTDLLTEFHTFLRIMLTIPVTSCTSERSFSALRRLKTYLRSTMTQNRLNDLAILHIHKDLSKNIDINSIANDFINVNNIRRNTFFIEN